MGVSVAEQRQTTTKHFAHFRGHQSRGGGTIRSDMPMKKLSQWLHLHPGDEVLARWALRNGEPSESVEEALVLAVDSARGKVLLRYVDGMELLVPFAWIFER